MEKPLPSIPVKRYFTIGEVSDLCGVKPHVLRYWEQEFTQLRPMKRRGNRRYYQHHEVLMVRRIRDLLYDQGFTITGARNKLQESFQSVQKGRPNGDLALDFSGAEATRDFLPADFENSLDFLNSDAGRAELSIEYASLQRLQEVRRELLEIRDLLGNSF